MEKIVFESRPKDFLPKMEVAACYCKAQDKFLFLETSDNKAYANTWSVPAGKIDPGESAIEGAVREMFEETGVLLKPQLLIPFKSVYVRYPKYDFMYHMFKVEMTDFPEKIILRAREHKKFAWLTKEEFLQCPLIPGADESFLLVVEVW
ncbi:NUDIX hydrolase [Candidatus Dependentiae bacterium]|nr:NUDIX hydrolase [Candidatus Dependentiae bacterium]